MVILFAPRFRAECPIFGRERPARRLHYHQIGCRFKETSEPSSGSEDALDLLANFLVRHRLAVVQRRQPLLHLSLEPLVMVKIVCDQFLHDLVRSLAGLGSNPGKPCLKLGS